MLRNGVGAMAILAASTALSGLIAGASQGAKYPTLLWVIILCSVVATLALGIVWWLIREQEPERPVNRQSEAKAEGYQTSAKSANRDLIDHSVNIFPPASSPAPSSADTPAEEDRSIGELRTHTYEIGDKHFLGDELFARVGECLARTRDSFYFGADAMHKLNLGLDSRSVPAQQILTDWTLIGVVDSKYIPQISSGSSESPVKRPESEHQYQLSELGKRVLRSSRSRQPSRDDLIKGTIAQLTTLATEGSQLSKHEGARSLGLINVDHETPAELAHNKKMTEYQELAREWGSRVRQLVLSECPEFVADWDAAGTRDRYALILGFIRELRNRL